MSPATSDEYLRSFHDPAVSLSIRGLAARMAASISTLGFGGAMGLEGPSLYLGATIGSQTQRRLPRLFRDADRRLLMVAGAAAGVAAIFKAPATGAIFAIEVPYQDELARRLLLPALVSAATGYLAFVAVDNTDRLFPIAGEPSFNFRDLIGALALGVAAGLAARAFAASVLKAKQLAESPSILRPLLAGALLAGIFVITRLATGESLTFGPGYDTIAWALDPTTERGSCCSCSCCAARRRRRPSVAAARAGSSSRWSSAARSPDESSVARCRASTPRSSW